MSIQGLFRFILDHFGSFWFIFQPFQSIFRLFKVDFGSFCFILFHFVSFLDNFWFILVHFSQFGVDSRSISWLILVDSSRFRVHLRFNWVDVADIGSSELNFS